MAEKCVDVPVISGLTMSTRVGVLRRRHTSGKTSPGNNEEKLVPHYLRDSTGSCHDFCKYGMKLALEEKKKSLIPRIAERTQLHRSTLQNLAEIVTSGVKLRASMNSKPTKMSLVKHRKSTDSEVRISNVSDTTKVVKTEPCELVKPGKEVVVNRKKTSLAGVKRLPLLPRSQNCSTYKTRKPEISSSSKVDTTPKPISKRVGASSISNFKKEELLLKSTSRRVKTHPVSTFQLAKTSSNSTSKKTQISSKFSEKNVTSLNLDSSKADSPRASLSSKSSRRRVAGINIHKSLKTASRVKNYPKPKKVEHEEHYSEAEEKTLYVIKMENEDSTFQSDQNAIQDIELSPSKSLSSSKFSSQDQEESEYATSEFEEHSFPENDGKENKETLETLLDLEVEENEKPQKGETEKLAETESEKSCPTENYGNENKETLERLDLEVEENEKPQKVEMENLAETEVEKNSPSKLKLNGGKVLKENATDGDETVAITGLEKIVLRHQDVKGKKDEQVLLNNVIEETASKLVEPQKGKVKALVGAFETLISLNEKKT
ncbi:putative Calmodulin-binding domain, plant [Medicago truncatula]|uniref:Plant calmodulin-binding-like protein n=1 Tax=Medicago truncatula TaxID=3880 RepID=G7L455_MEDTR|nr:uncharacterized protein LOC11437018 [Medicago truncatula]AES77572.1 plant calmodulin-binding-like protein [Medicago truncatula]RHN44342.1 putative Calmodulin-binding domain, plant [Medicago truncatula]